MKVRFIDWTGKEQIVSGLAALMELSQSGVLTPDTLVFDEAEGRWRPAREIGMLSRRASAPSLPDPEPAAEVLPRVEPPPIPIEETPAESTPEPPSPSPPPQSDRRLIKIARIIFAVDALAVIALFATLPNPKAAEIFTEMFLKGLLGLGALYFTIKGWGKGQALLTVSILLLAFCGYFGVVTIQAHSNSTRKNEVIGTALSDIMQRSQAFAKEVNDLEVEKVFAVLDGQEPSNRATLERLQSNVRIAESKTDRFVSSYEERIAQVKRELADIDPSAGDEFMKAMNNFFPRVREMYSEQSKYCIAIDALLTYLLEGAGAYEITARGIRFRNNSDSDVYNRLIDEINFHAVNLNSQRSNATGK